jgi:hypothetical protein
VRKVFQPSSARKKTMKIRRIAWALMVCPSTEKLTGDGVKSNPGSLRAKKIVALPPNRAYISPYRRPK